MSGKVVVGSDTAPKSGGLSGTPSGPPPAASSGFGPLGFGRINVAGATGGSGLSGLPSTPPPSARMLPGSASAGGSLSGKVTVGGASVGKGSLSGLPKPPAAPPAKK